MSENNKNVYNYFMEKMKFSKEDSERVFTNEELIELCLKHKCRVDIWRWNPVYEYRLLFEENGRYQSWDDKKKLKMLKKAVNKNKATATYSDEEIAETRKKERDLQKKDSILSLNLWDYRRRQQEKEQQQQQQENESVSTEEEEIKLNLTNSFQGQLDLSHEIDFDDLSWTISEDNFKSQVNNQKRQETILDDSNTSKSEFDCDISNIESLIDDEQITINSPEDIMLTPNSACNVQSSVPKQNLQSQNNGIAALFNELNTESITINTESIIVDQDFTQPSQELPHCYGHFQNEIPVHSTQQPEA